MADTEFEKQEVVPDVNVTGGSSGTDSPVGSSELINASGHVQQLDRNFSLVSLCAMGVVTGSEWPALGGSILVAIFNGGPPGVLYEFIAVTIMYLFVSASIAELASSIPSSAGVYHWASVTPGKSWGRVVGFYAGWWNTLAWVLGGASMSSIIGNITVQMYAANHPEFVARPWHVFVVYIIVTWMACLLVCFANRLMPMVTNLGIFFIIVGVLVSIIVLAVMPGRNGRPGHASNSFVWSEWSSELGYPQGFVFMLGMLNGAYAVGTPDVTSHLAEEIPNPHLNIPKAIAAQMIVGFITAFAYLIALLYAISDYNALFTSPFPIATIYLQATGSNAGTVGLLVCIFFPILCTLIGCYLTAGRMFWSLARDGASPFSHFFSHVSPGLHMPFRATIACCTMITILGAIYVGSVTAFNAFVGVFVIMSTSSYTAAILPHLITRRSNIIPGPFWMKGWIGFVVNALACSYMIVFIVIYSFPYYLPTDAQTMNYACLMYGGLTILVTIWWLIGARKGYKGPQSIGGITEADMIKGQVRVSTARVSVDV